LVVAGIKTGIDMDLRLAQFMICQQPFHCLTNRIL
jgi:hypothetical protein